MIDCTENAATFVRMEFDRRVFGAIIVPTRSRGEALPAAEDAKA